MFINSTLRKTSTPLAAVGVCLSLGCSMAAASDEPNCRQIRSTGFLPGFQLPCELDPAYFSCYFGTTIGDLKGNWLVFLEQPGIELSGFGLPLPGEALTSYYNSETDVFTTSRGSIVGYSHYVFDDRTFESGGYTQTIFVTGGTGIYTNATGWIVGTATNAANVRYALRGKVCGPRIPRHLGNSADD